MQGSELLFCFKLSFICGDVFLPENPVLSALDFPSYGGGTVTETSPLIAFLYLLK